MCECEAPVNVGKAMRYQVVDLPPISPVVTQYLRVGVVCSGCDHHTMGSYRRMYSAVSSPGPGVLALVRTLLGQFYLTQVKIPYRLLDLVVGLQFSIATISMAFGHVDQALAELVQHLHTHLSLEAVRDAGETSHMSHSHLMWTWTQAYD